MEVVTNPVIGRLNGIHGEPGTIIGYHKQTEKFLAIAEQDERGCTIRHATDAELKSIGYLKGIEPRSITEHRAVARMGSPYGLVRQWRKPNFTGFLNKPTPYRRLRIVK